MLHEERVSDYDANLDGVKLRNVLLDRVLFSSGQSESLGLAYEPVESNGIPYIYPVQDTRGNRFYIRCSSKGKTDPFDKYEDFEDDFEGYYEDDEDDDLVLTSFSEFVEELQKLNQTKDLVIDKNGFIYPRNSNIKIPDREENDEDWLRLRNLIFGSRPNKNHKG